MGHKVNKDDKWRESWTKTTGATEYGELFFKRATGDLDEMECSKAAASRMRQIVQENDIILDVGCGAGHYLVSLKKTIDVPFHYIGIDATSNYVELARKAFGKDPGVEFREGDIFLLPLEEASVDVTMCCNVLLHLPSIVDPLHELVRVSRRKVLIRTLIDKTSFIIKHVDPVEDGNEFDGQEPRGFHFLNIYSQNYMSHVLKQIDRVEDFNIVQDIDFDPSRLSDTTDELTHSWDATRAVNGMQISGNIVQPWAWLQIDLKT